MNKRDKRNKFLPLYKLDERGHYCKTCNKDLNHYSRECWECRTCAWKKKYFGGLYWKTLTRDNNKCTKCGRGDITLNVHHVNHNSKDNRMENLETLCVNCHSKKRKFNCVACGKETIANSAHQKRCKKCFVIHEKFMSYRRQLRYWRKHSEIRAKWYELKINKLLI